MQFDNFGDLAQSHFLEIIKAEHGPLDLGHFFYREGQLALEFVAFEDL